MEPIRLLIVDDHPMFRRGLRTLLAALPEVRVVGEAGGGDEAVRLAAELQPDLVLMDLQMPGGSGLAATRAIVNADPHTRVLVVTLSGDKSFQRPTATSTAPQTSARELRISSTRPTTPRTTAEAAPIWFSEKASL